jgi:hypothetical protein
MLWASPVLPEDSRIFTFGTRRIQNCTDGAIKPGYEYIGGER